MSNIKPRFSPELIDNQNILNVKSTPKLMLNSEINELKARNSEAKVYFMSNCGWSIDSPSLEFTNFISKVNDPMITDCLKMILKDPQCISMDVSAIRMGQNNTQKLKLILKQYMNQELIDRINDHLYESKIVSKNIPLTYKGPFRVFVVHDYSDKIGNILYTVFYDPYHLVFVNDKFKDSYSKKKGYFSGTEMISIYDKYHSGVSTELIKEFDGLVRHRQ